MTSRNVTSRRVESIKNKLRVHIYIYKVSNTVDPLYDNLLVLNYNLYYKNRLNF